MQFRPTALLALFAFIVPLTAEQAHLCRWCSAQFAPAAVDSPAYRKYAPDRRVDLLHLALDVTPNFKARTVAGTATRWTIAAADEFAHNTPGQPRAVDIVTQTGVPNGNCISSVRRSVM